MAGLFEDVPKIQYSQGQPIVAVPNPAMSQPQRQNAFDKILTGLSESLLPSGFNQAFQEKDTTKATLKFVKGLAETAIMLPKGAFYDFPKSAIAEFQKSKKPEERPISYSVSQGLKEGGLSVGFLSGLQHFLPLLIMGGAVLKLPVSATATERVGAMVVGGPIKEPKITQEAKVPEPLSAFRPVKEIETQMRTLEQGITDLKKKVVLETPKKEVVSGEMRPDTLRAVQVKTLKQTTDLYNKLKIQRNKMAANILDTIYDIPRPGKERIINTLSDDLKAQIIKDNTPPVRPGMIAVGRSVEARLMKQGVAGRQLVDEIRGMMEKPDLQAGDFDAQLLPVFEGMSRNELFNVKGALQGKTQPINIRVAQAVDTIKAHTDVIRRMAESRVPGFRGISDYYHQNLPSINQLKNKVLRQDITENMVNLDKSVSSAVEANALLNDWGSFLKTGEVGQALVDYVKRTKQINIADDARLRIEIQNRLNAYTQPSMKFGAFEPRTLDLPFYDPNPARVIPNYYRGAFEYLYKVEHWGKAGEKLYDLVDVIRQQSGDANFAQSVVDFLVKGETGNMALTSLRDFLLKYNAATKMDLSFVANSMQGFLGTALMGNLKTAIKTIGKIRDIETKEFAMRTGGITGGRLGAALQGTIGVDISTGLGSKVLKLFKVTELDNFYRSIVGGKMFMQELTDRLQKNAADKFAIRKLKELKFKDEEIANIAKSGLTEEQLYLGSVRFWKEAQAIPDILSIPLGMQTSAGRIVTQFKHTAYRQTSLIWNGVIKELKAGNPTPLLVLATVFPAVGEVIADVKALLRGQSPFRKGGGSLITEPNIINYFERMGQAFGFGLASDLYRAVSKPYTALGVVGGPSTSFIEGGQAAFQVLSKPQNLIKWGLQQLPFVGKPLKNILFPAKAKAAGTPRPVEGYLDKNLGLVQKDAQGRIIGRFNRETIFDKPVNEKLPNINNNPGNLEYRSWMDDFYGQKNGRFAKFSKVEDGIDALRHLLTEKYVPETTIRNALKAFVGTISSKNLGYTAQQLGFKPNQKLGDLSYQEMNRLIYGIAKMEGFKQLPKLAEYLGLTEYLTTR